MEDLRKLKVVELQALLRKRRLSASYRTKEDLIERLTREPLGKVNSGEEEESGSLSEGSEEEEFHGFESTSIGDQSAISENLASSKNNQVFQENKLSLKTGEMSKDEINSGMSFSNFLFRDIEESLEQFNGETSRCVTTWVKNFEDTAVICKWNDVQKYLYARRLLKGAAKLSVEASTDIHSWENLKSHLLEEFAVSVSSISIHKALENRKKKPDESLLEYMYAMKAIGNKGQIDDESLILYIINGIPDDTLNKTVLYEAQNLNELKQKLKIYQTMKQSSTRKVIKPDNKAAGDKEKSNQVAKSRCSLCGAKSHLSNNCPNKAKGCRCFNCNDFGHIASNCPQPKASKNSNRNVPEQGNVNIISIPDLHTKVIINNQEYIGLIDTGSDVTLLKKSVWRELDLPMQGCSICLTGFGRNLKHTLGSFIAIAQISSEDYKVRFHVVPDEWITPDILLGKDILKESTLVLTNGRATISKVFSNCRQREENFLEKLDVVQLVKEAEDDMLEDIEDKAIREKVKTLIENYHPSKPEKSCIEMAICLEDERPVYQKPRRMAPQEKEIVDEQVQAWLGDGVIRPSSSDFASPVVLTKKKDGTNRLCVDFRQLNKKIIKDRYPLPLIEEILEGLYDASIFTTLDLRNGFFHVDIREESRKYTSFVTFNGQYEFCKAPFGLCNSPAAFQRYINTVFQTLIRKNVLLIYMDDIIIPSNSEEENIAKLKLTLETAEMNGLVIKWSKCKFFKRSIEFLGHVVEKGSIRPSPNKIMAVKGFPTPKNVKEVQSFLGLTGFFRKFVSGYSAIAKPLTDLTKKDSSFIFGAKEQDAFNLLKDRLCSDPVLKLFNPGLETELHTDASKTGYGAVLPIARHLS